MKSTHLHALQFVRSKGISEKYPTIKIDTKQNELVSMMEFVEKMYPSSAIIVCQRSPAPAVQYVSVSARKVFGFEARDMMNMSLPDFLDRIHPEDVNDIDQCYAFINSTEPYDPSLNRFEVTYRLKHKQGQYIHISETKMAIENSEGKLIYLNSYKDISLDEKFHNVRLNIYQCLNGDFKKINTYHPRRKADELTPRQNEIANFIRKGFSNEEIAGRLHVSISTVKNHKNRLFKKTRVKTSRELASMANGL